MAKAQGKSGSGEDKRLTTAFPGLIDLVVNEERNRVEFLYLGPEGRWRSAPSFSPPRGTVKWIPPPSRSIPWLLPRREQVARYVKEDTDAAYFGALLDWIKKHVDLTPAYAVLLAAWIVHTYLIDLLYDSPYVVLAGPPETGKSRAVAAAIHTARRGILTMNVREAALIRYAADYYATVAIDTTNFMEAIKPMMDFFAARTKNDGSVTTRILDFTRGPFEGIRHYNPFGATLVASNAALSDDIIASRSLVIQARQSSRRFPAVTPELALPLRERGTAFRVRALRPAKRRRLPELPALAPGRLGELLSGLALAVALTDPSQIPILRDLADGFAAARRTEVQDTLEVELLGLAIRQIEQADKPKLRIKLVDFVRNVNADRRDTGDKFLTPRGASSTLRTTLGLTLKPGTGNYTFVTFRQDQLTELAARYGLQPPGKVVKKPARGP